MKYFWIVIALKHLSIGGIPVYLGNGPYAHPTEKSCTDYAEDMKTRMYKAGYNVEVKCEKVVLTD